jgi:serine protease Do
MTRSGGLVPASRRRAALAAAAATLLLAGCNSAESRPAGEAAPQLTGTPGPPVVNINRRDAVVEVVERIGPSIVNISTEVRIRNPYYESFDMFDWFFGRRGARPREYSIENSLGSGVIVDPRGYVLTNDHVIASASRITVSLRDGRQVEAEVVGTDRNSDLAVLRLVEEGEWPAAPIGTSSDLMVGETVIAIGNPFGFENTVTVGVVSAIGRTLGGRNRFALPYADFLQTDAAINPGNSGGALLNIRGELIGVNTMIAAQGQNLGFAIPADSVRKVFEELVTYRRVRAAWTGLAVESLDSEQAEALGIPGTLGVYVRKRHADSPAEEAGLRAGDAIVTVGGEDIATVAEFHTAIEKVPYGKSVRLETFREGKSVRRDLVVEAFPEERADEFLWRTLGIAIEEDRSGVVISRVDGGSFLGREGLPSGYRLLEINGRKVTTLDEVRAAVPELLQQRAAHVVVASRRSRFRVTVPLD